MFASKLVILATSLLAALEHRRSDSGDNGDKGKGGQPLVGMVSVLDAATESAVKEVLVTVQSKESGQEADRRLDALLEQYEKANSQIRDVRLEIERRRLDPIFCTEEIEYGTALVKKPGLVRVDWRDSNHKKAEIIYGNGNTLSYYDFASKKVFVADLQALRSQGLPKGIDTQFFRNFVTGCCAIANDRLGFVYFGMSLPDLKKRFRLTLIQEDGTWAWLRAEPHDQSLYQYVQIAIDTTTHLPGIVQFVEPNGCQVIYKIKVMETNMRNPPSEEALSNDLPKGWDKTVYPPPDAK
jgi:hypothetical protein